ncbi:MAG: hypothetical protein U0794_01375 [Isosphaeraceae bacterium]
MAVPPVPRQTAPSRRPARPGPDPARRKVPRIGWLGAFVLSQTMLMAALFIPNIASARAFLRIGGYLMGLVFWALIVYRGKPEQPGPVFPPRAWLTVCAAWLLLMIVHPNTYSLITGVAQTVMYIAIFSPAFWTSKVVSSSKQLPGVIAVMFACNAISVLLGIGQVYRPETFNPPVIPAMSNQFKGEDVMYDTDDGRRIMRPCGLSDTPGSAAPAGTVVALFGLCFALQPIAIWKRAGALGLAFLGVACIYYSHVRMTLIMLMFSMIALAILLTMQRNYRQASLLITGGVGLIVGAMLWAISNVGIRVLDRFMMVIRQGPVGYTYQSRGALAQEGLTSVLYYPLGYGLGWWGMIYSTFGNPARTTKLWVEVMVQAWTYDGGLPLLIGYGGAVVVAILSSVKIALKCRDREVAYWAAVVFASNLSVAMSCFSYVTFLSPIGMNFWLLSAVVYAADRRYRISEARPAAGPGGPGPGPGPRPQPRPQVRPRPRSPGPY